MKKFKKVLYVIISVVIFAGAIAAALDFMGVINLKNHDQTEDETLYSELWHIVFKGYAFSVKPAGIAIIHESVCLNFSLSIRLALNSGSLAGFFHLGVLRLGDGVLNECRSLLFG